MTETVGGKLVLVATPIGNLSDLSPRAVEALGEAEFWIVEDSRISGKLASHLGLKKPMKVLNDHTSSGQVDRYLGELQKGAHAALLTDGGAPAISDPGALLTDQCHNAGIHAQRLLCPAICVSRFSRTETGFDSGGTWHICRLAFNPRPI